MKIIDSKTMLLGQPQHTEAKRKYDIAIAEAKNEYKMAISFWIPRTATNDYAAAGLIFNTKQRDAAKAYDDALASYSAHEDSKLEEK